MKVKIIILFVFLTTQIFGQNMKPRIMVIPADIYMTKNNWVDKNGNPDYAKAFKNDNNIRLAVSKLSESMGKRGFPLVSLEMQLKGLQNESILNENYEGRGGDQIQLTVLDEIFQSTQPDIVMDIDYTLQSGGMVKKLLYNLQAFDTYTYKPLSSVSGTGPGTGSNDIPALLQIAIKDNMDNFCAQLTDHFHKTMEIGREIKIQIKVNSDDVYLDDEYVYDPYEMDDELNMIIEQWFYENAKGGMYKVVGGDLAKTMKIEEIRIPIVDDKGRAIDAYKFINGLKKMLRKEPFNITGKTIRVKGGLGEAWLILGNK